MAGRHHQLVLQRQSILHRARPEVKVVATGLFSFGVAITPRELVGAFAIDAVVVVAALAVAGYRPHQVIARSVAILPFLTLAATTPFIAHGDPVAVGWLTVSSEGLWASWNTAAKTTLGFGSALILAGTTPTNDLVVGLSRLRVPSVVVTIIAFLFRYLDVLVEELARIRVAMTSRGHDPRWLWQARPLASAAGGLFVRSFERGERVHHAMLARGFTGSVDVDLAGHHSTAESTERPDQLRQWAAALTFAAVPWVGATLGWSSPGLASHLVQVLVP